MFDELPTLDSVLELIEADGQDPEIVLPLYDLLAEAAAIGVRSKAEGDMLGATIGYGRVSAIFDVLCILGIPVPAASPAEIMEAASMVLGVTGPADSGDDA